MSRRILVTALASIAIGIVVGLVAARQTFGSQARTRDLRRDYLAMTVRGAETSVLRTYIALLEQDRFVRDGVATMESWTDQQRGDRIQTHWDVGVHNVLTQLDLLGERETQYLAEYPKQHQSDPVFAQIREALETGNIGPAQQDVPDPSLAAVAPSEG